MVRSVQQGRQRALRHAVGVLLELCHAGQLLGADALDFGRRKGAVLDDRAHQPERRAEVGAHRRQIDGRAIGRAAGADFGAETFPGLRQLLRTHRRRALVEHRHGHHLKAATVDRIGRIASVEAERDLGDRNRGALRIFDLQPVRQAEVADVREIERGKLAERRDRASGAARRGGRFRVGLGRAGHRGDRLGFFVSGALARLEPQRECRAGQPLLHRALDFSRGDGGVISQRLGVEIAVAGEGLALGQGHRLATETADRLEPADALRHFGGRRSAHFLGSRALGDVFSQDLVDPPFDQRRVDPRLDRRLSEENADSLERIESRRNRRRNLFVANQDLVEPRACKPAEHRSADVERH